MKRIVGKNLLYYKSMIIVFNRFLKNKLRVKLAAYFFD